MRLLSSALVVCFLPLAAMAGVKDSSPAGFTPENRAHVAGQAGQGG